MTEVPFSCACGKLNGTLSRATPSGGNHCKCLCDSCRAGAVYCKTPELAEGGLALFLTTPDRITITSGFDQLAPFSFGAKNIIRWQAKCCGVQMFSTPANPKMAMTSISTARLTDPAAIGPVRSRAFVPQPNGKTKHENIPAFIGTVARVLRARFTGRWKETPFFDSVTLEPTVTVTLISKEDRRALLAR
tara:strand:- start:6 stop:575 length:570 start_codon:yes stop_codon:yes gene_type:complete